jgi:hypothetical protein
MEFEIHNEDHFAATISQSTSELNLSNTKIKSCRSCQRESCVKSNFFFFTGCFTGFFFGCFTGFLLVGVTVGLFLDLSKERVESCLRTSVIRVYPV